MKKKIILGVLFVGLLCCNFLAYSQNTHFAFSDNSLGVIVGNTVKYYRLSSGSWSELTDRQFALPNGYANVFAFNDNSLGAIIGNAVKYYRLSSGNWSELTDRQFSIQ